MPFTEDEVNSLCQQMEQEIDTYRLLIHDLEEEADCLKRGAIDTLIRVVVRIEQRTATLQQTGASVQTSVEKLLDKVTQEGDRTFERLLTMLPPSYRGRLKSNQKTLVQLQEWVRQTNGKNKLFIQDHLTFLSDLVSSMIHPPTDPPCYQKPGRSSSSVHPSYALSREV